MQDAVQPVQDCSVLIVIVNYRTANLTVNCLRSLESEVAAHPSIQVAVVDNASGDDSLEIDWPSDCSSRLEQLGHPDAFAAEWRLCLWQQLRHSPCLRLCSSPQPITGC